jgi:hypothetical protein
VRRRGLIGGIELDDDLRLWLDPDGGMALKAITPEGDPVELTASQARELASALVALADQDGRRSWSVPKQKRPSDHGRT